MIIFNMDLDGLDGKEKLLLLLSKRLVTQAYILVLRSSDRLKPGITFAMDLRFSKDDIQRQHFLARGIE